MIDVFAIALKGRVDLLLAEMQSISPVDVSILHECDVRVTAVVLLLEETIIEAGVDHEQDVVEVQRMSDGMFIEKDLFFVLP